MKSILKQILHSLFKFLIKFPGLSSVFRFLGIKTMLPNFVWQRLPIESTFPLYFPSHFKRENRALYFGTPEDPIARAMFWRGWECFGLGPRIFYELAKDSKIMLDIGANTGVYTLLALTASTTSKVWTFEPIERVFNILKKNVALNDPAGRCQTFQVGVSDSDGSAEIFVSHATVPGNSTIMSRSWIAGETVGVTIPIRSIDSIVNELKPKPKTVDLVKIDVELAEQKVLEGMNNTIHSHRPIIYLEISPESNFEAINAIISAESYLVYANRDHDFIKSKTLVQNISNIHRNQFCVPEEKEVYFLSKVSKMELKEFAI